MAKAKAPLGLVVYSNPDDLKLHENRRFVRSHVTKLQHLSSRQQSNSRSLNTPPVPSTLQPSYLIWAPSEKSRRDSLQAEMQPTYELSESPGLPSPLSTSADSFDDTTSVRSPSLSQSGFGKFPSISDPELALENPFDDFQDINYRDREQLDLKIPPSLLPQVPVNDDARSAHDAACLLLKATGQVDQEYELVLEALACAKINSALKQPNTTLALIRAIMHMAHYDLISPFTRPSMFAYHMACLAERIYSVGGIQALPRDLQHKILQIDQAVSSFRGTASYFPTMLVYPLAQ